MKVSEVKYPTPHREGHAGTAVPALYHGAGPV